MNFTEEQLIQLAPDAASLKAGRELSNERKWGKMAYNQRVLWGEVQGSGKAPYRTQIDLTSTAFKCSCPSRKFPCKHGLGLLFIFVRNPAALVANANEPAWVSEWIEKRNQKTEQETAPEAPKNKPTDELKKARDREKRQNERLSKAQAGVAELDLWLRDLIRTGLLTLPERGYRFFEQTAARMVDAQVSGLAARVRGFNRIAYASNQNWQTEALTQAAQLFLLTEAFRNLGKLPTALQEDVKNLIGWSRTTKELLEKPDTETIADLWLVLGRTTELDDKITTQRNWLYGYHSGRFALVLNFAYQNTAIETPLLPGAVAQCELTFYPSACPFRAVVKEHLGNDLQFLKPVALPNWEAAQEQLTDVWSQQPWADDWPQWVKNLRLVQIEDNWHLADENNQTLPISPKFDDLKQMKLLAQSGGMPFTLSLVRAGKSALPLGLWADGQYVLL